MSKGTLFVISGPSGVGKGTLVARLCEERPSCWVSVSATTRAPREGEVDGQNYFFMDRSDFLDLVDAGGFLEWAEYSGNCYGTPLHSVEEHLNAGEDVILEIEVQGAAQIKEQLPDAKLIFIEPPSMEELERRLTGRGTENIQSLSSRLSAASVELQHKMEYDMQLVNDDLERATKELVSYIEHVSDQD